MVAALVVAADDGCGAIDPIPSNRRARGCTIAPALRNSHHAERQPVFAARPSGPTTARVGAR
jgi:hypothetical protein